MNILKRLLVLGLLSVAAVSCDHVINITEPGNLPAHKAFKSVSDLHSGLLALYGSMDNFNSIYFNSVFTDEIALGIGNGGQGRNGEYDFVLTAGSDMPATVWNSCYNVINRATRLLIAAKNIEPDDQQAYDNILGQVHAIRAYEYSKLISYYSSDITDSSSLGVILFDKVPDVTAQKKRSTTGETYKFINDDLDKAASMVSTTSIEQFNQGAITALRAQNAVRRKDYVDAEKYSQQILDTTSLAQPQEYIDMFRKDTPGEVIFKLARVVGDSYDQQADAGTPAGTGWIGNVYDQVNDHEGIQYEVSRTLWRLLNKNDIRKQVTAITLTDSLKPTQNKDSITVLSVGKYIGLVPDKEKTPLMNDQLIFRVSEMLLINAEAKAAQKNFGGAAKDIKRLTDARYTKNAPPLPHYSSKKEAFAAIMKQRRIELSFEGFRWFGLRRLGPVANKGIDRGFTCNTYGACDGPVPGKSKKYVLPIPLNELNANHHIKQNPGYSGGAGSS